MELYVIDVETRSEIDLGKCGVKNYAAHPSTDVLCLWIFDVRRRKFYPWHKTIDSHTDEEKAQTHSEAELKVILNKVYFSTAIFIAHNAAFEREIWEEILYKRYCFPRINQKNWFCTMAQAAYNGLPQKLEKLCLILNNDQVKDDKGHAHMLKMCKPRKPTKKNPARWVETMADMNLLSEYCKQDVLAEFECFQRSPVLDSQEYALWFLDQEINRRGVPVDVEFIEEACKLLSLLKEKADERLKIITEGKVSTGKQQKVLLNYFSETGITIPDCTRETMLKLLDSEAVLQHPNKEVLREIIYIRLAALYTSLAKYEKMRETVTPEGRIHYNFNYYGAITGRWAGRGVQLQNLPRGEILLTDKDFEKNVRGKLTLDKVFQQKIIDKITTPPFSATYQKLCEIYVASIRHVLATKKSYRFFNGDFSSIEARVLLWLVKDTQRLEGFRRGDDLYRQFSASIYNVTEENVTKAQRRVGKTAILGLGYGMGEHKFLTTAEKQGITLSLEQAFKIKSLYRLTFTSIVQAWAVTERSAREALTKKGSVTDFTGIVWEFKTLQGTPFLLCTLPSKRMIKYPFARLVGNEIVYKTVNSKTRKVEDIRTYGAQLVENIVQGIARDILAEAMLRLNSHGYDIIFTAHDEIMAEMSIVNAKNKGTLEQFIELMKVPPVWCADLPLDVNGWEGKRYKKD